MKQRILTGLISGLAFIGVLFAMHTIVLPFVLSLLSAIAVYEALKAIRIKNKAIRFFSIAVSAVIPILYGFGVKLRAFPLITLYIIFTFILMIFQYEKTKFDQAVFAIFASLVLPFAFTSMLFIRDIYITYEGIYSKNDGIFLILLGIFCAWFTDIFAFFAGSFFGKHKLAPKISPKKTIEGSIGGVIGTLIANLILLAVFKHFFFDESLISYWALIPVSIVLSVISMCGDLTASILKRNYKIKDFGNLLPGHGGILDRFDSFLFVLPSLYAIIVIIYY